MADFRRSPLGDVYGALFLANGSSHSSHSGNNAEKWVSKSYNKAWGESTHSFVFYSPFYPASTTLPVATKLSSVITYPFYIATVSSEDNQSVNKTRPACSESIINKSYNHPPLIFVKLVNDIAVSGQLESIKCLIL